MIMFESYKFFILWAFLNSMIVNINFYDLCDFKLKFIRHVRILKKACTTFQILKWKTTAWQLLVEKFLQCLELWFWIFFWKSRFRPVNFPTKKQCNSFHSVEILEFTCFFRTIKFTICQIFFSNFYNAS